MVEVHGMQVRSKTKCISGLADQQTDGRSLVYRLVFRPVLNEKIGKEKIQLKLSLRPQTNRPPLREVSSRQRPKSRLSREGTFKSPNPNGKKESGVSGPVHGKKLSELSKDELKSISFPSRWGQLFGFPGKYGAEHKRQLEKLSNTLDSIDTAKRAWNGNKALKNLLELKIRHGLATNQEGILLKVGHTQEAGFKITREERELVEKIARVSHKPSRTIRLSVTERRLLQEFNRRTIAVRRQEQAQDLLSSFEKIREGIDQSSKTGREDVDLIVSALRDLGADEREGQFWTEYDVALIKALQNESEKLATNTELSNLPKIAKNLRNQKAYELLKGKLTDKGSPSNLKDIKFAEKVRKNTAYYRRSHPYELIEVLTESETREVKRLAKQYYWMKDQLWTPSNSELINRARKQIENSQDFSVVEMPIQALAQIQERKFTEVTPKLRIHRGSDVDTPKVKTLGMDVVDTIAENEVPNKMSSPEKLELLGLALGKIITAKSEGALGKLNLNGRLLKACREKVEDQDLTLKLAKNYKLEELNETELGKLQYLFPHELEQLARMTSSHAHEENKKASLEIKKIPLILQLIQKATDRINLSKIMTFKDNPGNVLMMEAEAQGKNLRSYFARHDAVYKVPSPMAANV
ncbi:hypothetical protein MJO28_017315 [Puccinia striiformis f. sp. tritici]|nr:hypothetical protein MJO28_017315 [Puccinia striiformis f. sp. tritici]KAI7957769.1 hypothetical protein MJO29_005986 [Puccinia striiformis f. sp. tritici]